ncbi:MAG: transporter substrate-binding domain-containing protein [Desulfobacterales bacterium]|nr:transporter substrate-binding domain-containing protein [Desulfobacterales bacterium]
MKSLATCASMPAPRSAAAPARGYLCLSLALLVIMAGSLLPAGRAAAAEAPAQAIRVGSNSDFAPYEFVNGSGQPDGYTVELMRAVARQAGLAVTIVTGPWEEMRQALETRTIDALTGVLYSHERDRLFDFSVPHDVVTYAIFVRENAPYRSVTDLKDKEVLVVSGVYAHDWLQANNFTTRIVTVDHPEQALQRLSSGQHDAAVLPRLHGLELMRRLKLANLETIGPPVLTQKLCFAVAAGNADLLARLNEGLSLVQKSGEYDRLYLKWFSLYEQKQRYWQYGLLGAGLLLGLASLVLVWNVSLKRSVARKTRLIEQREVLLHQIVQGLPMPTFVVDRNNLITHWNMACEKLTGEPATRMAGTDRHRVAFYRNARPPLSQQLLEKAAGQSTTTCAASTLLEGACEAEFLFQPAGLEGRWMYGTAGLLRQADGQVIGAIESWQDLTEHKRMEVQLLQSQKMEAIGTLAGGIAHDFSNMLTAIMAHAEMARRHAKADAQAGAAIQKVLEVCDHAKKLIRRILTFSRQTEVEVKPMRIDQLVSDGIDLIRATLPSSIQIVRELQCAAMVSVDATQIHQVLMNLCANAAHAMGGRRGTMTVRLAMADPQAEPLPEDVQAGRGPFVRLSVSDTGHGIPNEIQDRIFDPFFSTKKPGEGTGMGLAVSHGIVKRFGGAITLDSRVGEGATFNVYLPVIQGPEELAAFSMERMPKGKERLMLVSPSAGAAGDLLLSKLEQLGYRVEVCGSAEEATVELRSEPQRFDLLLITRFLSGVRLEAFIRGVRAIRPDLPIMLTAGYGTDPTPESTARLGAQTTIHEPIILSELAEALRKLLDKAKPSA